MVTSPFTYEMNVNRIDRWRTSITVNKWSGYQLSTNGVDMIYNCILPDDGLVLAPSVSTYLDYVFFFTKLNPIAPEVFKQMFKWNFNYD